jgi:hypothetical protein
LEPGGDPAGALIEWHVLSGDQGGLAGVEIERDGSLAANSQTKKESGRKEPPYRG